LVSSPKIYRDDIKNLKSKINFGRNSKDPDKKEEVVNTLRSIGKNLFKQFTEKLPHQLWTKKPIQELVKNLKKRRLIKINIIKTKFIVFMNHRLNVFLKERLMLSMNLEAKFLLPSLKERGLFLERLIFETIHMMEILLRLRLIILVLLAMDINQK
jgi:hypothetical protein